MFLCAAKRLGRADGCGIFLTNEARGGKLSEYIVIRRCGGMVDTRDLKSLVGNNVPVRVRSPAPRRSKLYIACSDLFYKSERAHAAAPPLQIEPAALGFDLGFSFFGHICPISPLVPHRSKLYIACSDLFYKAERPLQDFSIHSVMGALSLYFPKRFCRRMHTPLIQAITQAANQNNAISKKRGICLQRDRGLALSQYLFQPFAAGRAVICIHLPTKRAR